MKHHIGKRILCSVVAVMLLLCSMTAFASPKEEFLGLSVQEVTKAAVTYDFGLKLDQPLSAAMDESGELNAMLGDMTFHIDGNIDMSEDYKQMQAQMKVEVPSFVADIPGAPDEVGMWMDMDLTDTENPKFIAIMQDPESGKYGVIDYTAIDGMVDLYTSMLDMVKMKTLEKDMLDGMELPEEAFAKTEEGYTLTLTSEQLMQSFDAYMGFMSGNFKSLFAVPTAQFGMDEAEFEAELKQVMTMLKEFLSSVQLFGDPAVVMEYKVDDKNQPTAMNCSIKIDTNLADIVAAFDGADGFPIAREDAAIKATLTMAMTLSNVGEEQNITIPTLTAENSFDMLMLPEATSIVYDMNAINVVADGTLVTFPDAQPVLENDRTFVPVRAISNIFGIADENITYADGVVTIADNGKTITLAEGAMEVTIAEGDHNTKLLLDAAPFNREDRVYVPLRFVNDALGGTTDWQPLYGNGTETDATGSVVTVTLREVQSALRVMLPEGESDLADAFVAQSKEVGVDCELITAAANSYVERIALVVAAGDPMIVFVPETQTGQIAQFFDQHKGGLADLTDFVDTTALTDDQKAAVTGEDGNIYAYPAENGVFVLVQSLDNVADCVKLLQAVTK